LKRWIRDWGDRDQEQGSGIRDQGSGIGAESGRSTEEKGSDFGRGAVAIRDGKGKLRIEDQGPGICLIPDP
jgi:hypothetical protein